ncbi:pyruvate dehydrogenase (acetyl-transferring) E1 component subunit alpha [Blattabacterium cuenoti]|uniref:pyruvate dehydrogenase (acetyl-transferring) E1 component subunit alpha n=1 Tax=Blattabacterium cuenoti TaxID=1653831 RepID=UPI00163D1DDB|nr:pyruvate dehydrogenase (acetyl-transferring) E1 component subunit alpha [Blattabacterium cuenoti]
MKTITKNTYLKWFEDMSFWRKFEDKCRSLYLQQKIRGFLHLYNGQEAIPAGITHAIDISIDRIISAYRCHILPISMGVDPKKIMAELLGKETGTSCGIGGSMHIFSKKYRFYGGHGIVGGQIPLGAGIAFADKYFNRKSVTITLMGDGAFGQGVLHETFNMAMIWKLPVVFVCENNQYAMGTSIHRNNQIQELYKIGLLYGMPSSTVNGMNPEDIAKSMYPAVYRARNGKGPSFLDIQTYRYRGHSMSDAESYRSKDEINLYKKQDPILKLKTLILNNQWETLNNLTFIENKIKKKIEYCVEYAEKSNFPSLKKMYDVVYKDTNYPFIDKE